MSIQVEDKSTPGYSKEEYAREMEDRFWVWIRTITTHAIGSKLEASSLGFGNEEKVAFVAALGALSELVIKYSSEYDQDIYRRSIQHAIEALEPSWQGFVGKLNLQ